MIELLLEAERALAVGLVDRAEGLYRQAADHDPRNAIAVVGLARIALERGDEAGAADLGRRALEIDPDNLAARRLVDRLSSVREHRGEAPLEAPPPSPAPSPQPDAVTSRPSAPPSSAADPARSEPRRASGPIARLRRLLGRR